MNNSIYALIGKNIRHRRLELNMTTKELADRLDISRDDYLDMERGTKHIAAPLLLGLTKILDVRVLYFFEGRDVELGKNGSAMAKMYEILASLED